MPKNNTGHALNILAECHAPFPLIHGAIIRLKNGKGHRAIRNVMYRDFLHITLLAMH